MAALDLRIEQLWTPMQSEEKFVEAQGANIRLPIVLEYFGLDHSHIPLKSESGEVIDPLEYIKNLLVMGMTFREPEEKDYDEDELVLHDPRPSELVTLLPQDDFSLRYRWKYGRVWMHDSMDINTNKLSGDIYGVDIPYGDRSLSEAERIHNAYFRESRKDFTISGRGQMLVTAILAARE